MRCSADRRSACAPALRTLAWGAVAVGVATPLLRRRLRLPAPAVTVLSYQAPAALAIAAPRTRLRDAGIYALQMWAYFAHFDMPDDDPVAFAERVHVDYPIRRTGCSGRGRSRRCASSERWDGRARSARTTASCRRSTGAGSPCPTVRWPTCCVRHRQPLPELRGADGRVLRPGLRRLLDGAHRTALVGGAERQHGAGAAHHGRDRRARLGTRLASRSTVRSRAILLLRCRRFISEPR